jgi:hypothetical protein
MHNEFWSVVGLSSMILCLLILFGVSLASLGDRSTDSSDE